MNQEVAEKAWPLLKAFAEGKEIQYRDGDTWYKAIPKILSKNWFEYYDSYRIAPLKRKVPFDHKDKSKLLSQWITKDDTLSVAYKITSADNTGVYISIGKVYFTELFQNYKFISGAACCKEIEVES